VKKFIVTTTINEITPALKKFDNMEDWHLIAIGDKKTPNIKLKNGTFIPASKQSSLGFECEKHIPWNVIQRRNLGYLLAIREGADVIATIDDDNIPYDNWGKNIRVNKFIPPIRTISGQLACDSLYEHGSATPSKLWHRGFPIQLLEKRNETKEHVQSGFVDVEAGLWDGDPDVDAICRIAGGPFDLKFANREFLIDNRCFSPYNTQNTIFSRRVAPSMCLLFNVGRMDDIWASYMTQRIMRQLDSNVLFTGPTVYQDRNDHDLSIDLQAELIGYRNTVEFLECLNRIRFSDDEKKSVITMYAKIVEKISLLSFIGEEITNFQKAWLDDMSKIL
jgi:hypothetical protein